MKHVYPLTWPVNWPHAGGVRRAGGFQVSYEQAVIELGRVLERLDVDSAYLSTDQELRVTGTPRRDRPPASPGVALYFVRRGAQLCIPCDKFNSVRDNIRAIGLTLESIQRMERYGTSQMVEASLAGFAELPATASPNAGPRAWHEVLQVSPDADPSIIKAAYRNLAAKYHPDSPTRDDSKFLEVQRAFSEANQ